MFSSDPRRMRTALLAVVLWLVSPPADAQVPPADKCDAGDYLGYSIRSVEIRNPFDFVPFVKHRMEVLRAGLPVTSAPAFSEALFNESYRRLKEGVEGDLTFGAPREHVNAISDEVENCSDQTKTVDIVYRVFSIDPFRFLDASPEVRKAGSENPAMSTAETAFRPRYLFRPVIGFDSATRGFGGGDFDLKIPGGVLDSFHVSGLGSSSTRSLHADLLHLWKPGLQLLDRLGGSVSYVNQNLPSSVLQLSEASLQLGATAYSKPFNHTLTFRYGGSLEGGHQQTSGLAALTSPGTVANSSRAALRLYAGLTNVTRYSESALSYVFVAGGADPSQIEFSKHVADLAWSRRFPGKTHSPSDITVRLSGGGIASSSGLLLGDRFFGGNTIRSIGPDRSWEISNGPLVRSIPTNRFSGSGVGGTSFYSMNFTYGKIVKSWPIIPPGIDSPAFRDAIEAGENSAERFLRADSVNTAPEFERLIADFSKSFSSDLESAGAILTAIKGRPGVSAALKTTLTQTETQRKLAQSIVRHATIPDSITGRLDPSGMKTFLGPKSKLSALSDGLRKLLTLAPEFAAQLNPVISSIHDHLTAFAMATDAFEAGPVASAATARAREDMRRPREVIETLVTEVNSRSFALVAITDAGRLWPDPSGTRYAFGGGGRVSLLNINLTLGYAVNPHPRKELGQGRGALFLSLTYTNLFQ